MTRFDEIAEVYDAEIPDHVRLHLLARKTDMIAKYLGHLDKHTAVGVDLGCGTGWHVQRLRQKGFRTWGLDSSIAQLREAQHRAIVPPEDRNCWCLADIQRLPYADQSMDFVYAINAIHHMASREQQDQAILEVHRILKPEGLFFLHEVNTDNLILSTYMNHIFPRIRKIDDGEENWILPEHTDKWSGLERVNLTRFTFVPDFTPPQLFTLFRWLEGWLEKSPLRNYAAHFLAVLRREG